MVENLGLEYMKDVDAALEIARIGDKARNPAVVKAAYRRGQNILRRVNLRVARGDVDVGYYGAAGQGVQDLREIYSKWRAAA